MAKLLVKAKKKHGKVIAVTPASAKWKYVGHDVWKLSPGKSAKGLEAKRETCIVFISGMARSPSMARISARSVSAPLCLKANPGPSMCRQEPNGR